MDVHVPHIVSHGVCAEHDYSCPVYRNEHSVLDMSTGVFQPSWKAQKAGWHLVKADTWLKNFVLKHVFGVKIA